MINCIRGSSKPKRLRHLQFETKGNTTANLGEEDPNYDDWNEEKLEPDEFIIGIYGFLSKRFVQMEKNYRPEVEE